MVSVITSENYKERLKSSQASHLGAAQSPQVTRLGVEAHVDPLGSKPRWLRAILKPDAFLEFVLPRGLVPHSGFLFWRLRSYSTMFIIGASCSELKSSRKKGTPDSASMAS